jgi:hypothetical protein
MRICQIKWVSGRMRNCKGIILSKNTWRFSYPDFSRNGFLQEPVALE